MVEISTVGWHCEPIAGAPAGATSLWVSKKQVPIKGSIFEDNIMTNHEIRSIIRQIPWNMKSYEIIPLESPGINTLKPLWHVLVLFIFGFHIKPFVTTVYLYMHIYTNCRLN
jgi:hypothetical protein